MSDDTARKAAARFGEVLVSLGPTIDDEDHVLELLHRTAIAAIEVIEGADFCGITIDLDGRTYTACSTDEDTLAVDAQQYAAGIGPCLHASRTGETVTADCDAIDERWPEFGSIARDMGVHSVLAAAVSANGAGLGSVSLYGSEPGTFDDIDERFVASLSDTVGRAIGEYARYRSAASTAEGLRVALEHRAPIEQAKGILMALHRIGPDEAFGILSVRSQNTNRRLRDVAAEFVESVSRVDP